VDESLSPFPILLVVDFEVDDGCVCVAVACLLPGEVASGGKERNILEAELLCAHAMVYSPTCSKKKKAIKHSSPAAFSFSEPDRDAV